MMHFSAVTFSAESLNSEYITLISGSSIWLTVQYFYYQNKTLSCHIACKILCHV